MSSSLNIPSSGKANGVPQTPANSFASPSGLTAGSAQPTVEDVAEEDASDDDEGGLSQAALLANVSDGNKSRGRKEGEVEGRAEG